eukprot:gene1055-2065_t
MESWVLAQKELLELERQVERDQLLDKLTNLSAQECQELGISLLNLEVDSVRTSLYGRSCISLQRRDRKAFTINNFKVGDEAIILPYKQQTMKSSSIVSITGIISKVASDLVELIYDGGDDENLEYPLRLNISASESTFKKVTKSLNELGSLSAGAVYPLTQILFEDRPVGFVQNVKIFPFNSTLNSSQISAVEHALGSPHLALIHGPPGTGKTTTVIELILQAIAKKLKLLVCAPSNAAVDNILEKLVTPHSSSSSTSNKAPKPKVVRLGHPARVNPLILDHCLDALILNDDGTEIVSDVRKEIDLLRKNIYKTKDRSKRREIQSELRHLRKEARQREEIVVRSIIESRDVILCTLVGASTHLLREMEFDMVIIDEAAQALEAACWVPMQHSRKVILAGDHCQLPPTIKSAEAEKKGLSITLFERIITAPSKPGVTDGRLADVVRLLDTQYRMPSAICDWASKAMYEDKLHCHESVAQQNLLSLSGINLMTTNDSNNELSNTVLLLLDTAGCDMEEEGCRGGSFRNESEALVIYHHICSLVGIGVSPSDIGVITPYNGQVEILRTLLTEKFPLVNVRTVDGFQGGEKEVIIMSMVRSNATHAVGFLADKRRINVAVTRAKRHLAVVCDTETCSSDAFIRGLINHMSDHGDHRSVLEYYPQCKEIIESGAMKQEPIQFDPEISESAIVDVQKKREMANVSVDNGNNMSTSTSGKDDYTVTATAAATADGIKSLPDSRPLPPSELTHTKAPTQTNNASVTNESKASLSSKSSQDETTAGAGGARSASLRGYTQTIGGVESGNWRGGKVVVSRSLGVGQISLRNDKSVPHGVLRFPPSLSSYQRLRLHTVAEELDIDHRSIGEGADRFMEMTRAVATKEMTSPGKVAGVTTAAAVVVDARSKKSDSTTTNNASHTHTRSSIVIEGDQDEVESSVHIDTESASDKTSTVRHNEEDEKDEKEEEVSDSSGSGSDSDDENDMNTTVSEQKSVSKSKAKKNKKKKHGKVPVPVSNSAFLPLPKPLPDQQQRYCRPKVYTAPAILPDAVDDDDLLEAMIQSNQEHALNEKRKYRVSAKAMPNPATEAKRDALRNVLSEAQTMRKGNIS